MTSLTFLSEGHRAFTASDPMTACREAGEHFALLKARRKFGKNARVGAFRIDNRRVDGSLFECEAFIGRPAPGNPRETVGHNVRFLVFAR